MGLLGSIARGWGAADVPGVRSKVLFLRAAGFRWSRFSEDHS